MKRKLPALTAESSPFWQGGASGQLLIHFCKDCDRFFHPPGPICPRCTGDRIAPRPVSGKGKVATFTINHQRWQPDLEVPFVVAMVELDEQAGLRFVTNIINCAPAAVYVGMRVKVSFLQQEDVWLPLFEEDL
ncbi:MAG: DNA-binding protein [Gammaproteobacteria bacterium]|nr:DNA-binding protein [Gammaproteobacteria bacterium]